MLGRGLLQIISISLSLIVTGLARAADTASLDVPASVPAGAPVSVTWTGPGRQWDRIGIVPVGAPDRSPDAPQSSYASGNPVSISAPDQPGEYEVRYFSYAPRAVLARGRVTVLPVTATVEGPASALSGAKIEVKWTGPGNRYDRIYVVKANAPERAPSDFSAPANASPTRVTIPEVPGDYEIRYVTGATHTTLARAPLAIAASAASLDGPSTVTAGAYFEVSWTGPGNDYDYLAIYPRAAAADRYLKAVSVNHRTPTQLQAPLSPGEYELRYQTGQAQTTLARADLRVTPAKQEPGLVRVGAAAHGVSGGGAVEVILDASGSMLQKLGAERRIDIAKRTLKNLTASVIPAGTPFALRVFGREPGSCQTDLDIPPRPLDPVAVASAIDALTARSSAKTPIASSLDQVSTDLKDVRGERLVILVTDGEETCGGNPAQTIQKLMKQGIDVTINIIGFAVDAPRTAALFRQWSSAGRGGYFDARDAASLDQAFSLAVKPRYEIVDASERVVAEGVVGGEPVSALPGQYTVRLQGKPRRSQPATVRPNATTNVTF
jgi:von Willebrand factor type A domain-containing protein